MSYLDCCSVAWQHPVRTVPDDCIAVCDKSDHIPKCRAEGLKSLTLNKQHAMQPTSEEQRLNCGVEMLRALFAVWMRANPLQQAEPQEAPGPNQSPDTDSDG